jgi:hypothetical protein
MKELKIVLVLHLILGPLGLWIMLEDASHPERWGTWYRNPSYAVPYCLALEAFIWGLPLRNWMRERRFDKGIRLMEEANRLRAQGHYQAAEPIWEEGLRLTGQKP